MLEGRELEKKLGEYGEAYVDVKPDLKVEVALKAEIDLIAEVKKLAAKTDTPLDDHAIAWLEALIVKKPAV